MLDKTISITYGPSRLAQPMFLKLSLISFFLQHICALEAKERKEAAASGDQNKKKGGELVRGERRGEKGQRKER